MYGLGLVELSGPTRNGIFNILGDNERMGMVEEEMTMKKWDANPSTLESVLEELRSERSKINFILFLANDDPSTNRSWCPDCVRAEPVIYKTLEEWPEEVNLIRAYAGDRPTWRNHAHPWRLDPRFKLTGVPTLVRWDGQAVKARLEDHQAHLPHLILPLLASH